MIIEATIAVCGYKGKLNYGDKYMYQCVPLSIFAEFLSVLFWGVCHCDLSEPFTASGFPSCCSDQAQEFQSDRQHGAENQEDLLCNLPLPRVQPGSCSG